MTTATISSVSPSVVGSDVALHDASSAMRRAAEEFESVFLGQLLNGLTAGVAGPNGGSGDDDPFASMLQDEYAKLISRSGGIGIGDAVLREMLRMQEAA